MKLGCSYFGNRVLKHVVEDMRELKEMGCTYVVHTFNENDMVFYAACMQEIVAATQDLGLEVHIDPWGVGKVFGGESFSNFVMQNTDALQMVSDGRPAGAACPNHPRFRAFMREWVDAAVATGADVIFWDEPHFYISAWLGGRPNTFGCCCNLCRTRFRETRNQPFPQENNEALRAFKEECILEFLKEMIAYAHACGKRNALCVLPLYDDKHTYETWERMASIPHLDILGTDPYWIVFKKDLREFVGESARLVKKVCDARGLEAQLWLQGYKVPAGREDEVAQAVDLMLEQGIRNVAVWGFDACRHISWIRPDNPDLVWQKVREAYARARLV